MNSEAQLIGRHWLARDSIRLPLVAFLLLATTLAVYWPVSRHPFINYDDTAYVTENQNVQRGLTAQNVVWGFTNIEAAFWHPLTWLSHILDWQLFGDNAGGHHLTSVAWHLLNTLLLFLVLWQMTRALWRSAFVAALFALHPLHVESVAWVAERKDVLSTFFFLLTIWAYARYSKMRAGGKVGKWESGKALTSLRSHRLTFYFMALLFFTLGLMSKPMLVTLPFVLLILDYWPLQRFQLSDRRLEFSKWRPLLLEKIPFFALTVGACALAFITEHKAGAVRTLAEISFGSRLANAVISYVAYLRKTVWPADLAVFYPWPKSFPPLEILLAILLLTAITFAAVVMIRRRPYFALGWFWYMGTLVPVIGLVSFGIHSMADRFTYIPLIGVFMMITWGVAEISQHFPFRRWILSLLAMAALLGCIKTATSQLRHWQSDARLFEHALAVTRDNVVAHCHIAMALTEQGREAEAAQAYAAALRIHPTFADLNYNLGNFHRRHGRWDDAASYYLAELRLRPRHVRAKNNLGIVLANQKKTDEAIACFKTALEWRPDDADAHNNLAILLAEQGKADEALAHYRAALHSQPGHADAHLNLARLLEQQNQLAEAAENLFAVVRLRPNDAGLLERLSRVLARQGQTNEAANHLQKAQRIRRQLADSRNARGVILAQQGRTAEAIAEFKRALEEGADASVTHKNLALAYTLQTNVTEAISHYREALRLQPDFSEALNNLAWIFATHGDAAVRNGDEAVRLAEQAAKLTQRNDTPTLDTLAAAYAEAGRFSDAINTANAGVEIAQRSGQPRLATQMAERLKLYQAQQPFRE